MKVALIAPTQIPARQANTLQVMKMAQAFVITGHDLRMSVPTAIGEDREGFPEWQEIAHHYGLIHEFPVEIFPTRQALRKYDYAWAAVQWAQGWSADVVYTRLPQAAALSSTLGIRTVFEVHDFPHGFGGSRLFTRFLKGKGAARLVVISRTLTEDLRAKFGIPDGLPFTHIIPDGVDLERYSNLPGPKDSRIELLSSFGEQIDLKLNPDKFTIGYTGHLYPGRGVDLILNLAKRFPDMNFMLAGGEPVDVKRVSGLVAERGLGNITLTGFIPNADLPKFQAACDVLLMPYQQKVAASSGGDIARYLSPMKLFEYLACGRPICSSDLPVLREVLSIENAILLPANDINAWHSALLKLEGDSKLRIRLGKQASSTAALYTWDKRAEKVLAGL